MIPTSVTSSSLPTASIGSFGNQINNSPSITGSAKSNNGSSGRYSGHGEGKNSAFLGIASLILEGRALAENEYAQETSRYELKNPLSASSSDCGRQSPKPSTSRAAFGENTPTGFGSNSFSIDLANYLGRKSSRSPESAYSSLFKDYCNSSSSESASSSVESNHSRWSQKLSQLRQESPNVHHQVTAAAQNVAVECPRGSEAEYVSLAINTDNQHQHYGMTEDRKVGDFEIIRRKSINQMNLYNAPNSMTGSGCSTGGGGASSENLMCSLQSLASSTCLRVGSPLLFTTTSPPRYLNNKKMSSFITRKTTPQQHPQQQQQQQQQQQIDYLIDTSGSSGSSSGILVGSWYPSSSPQLPYNSTMNNSCNNKDYLLRKTSTTTLPSPQIGNNNKNISSSIANHNSHSSNIVNRNKWNFAAATTKTTTTTSSSAANASRNQNYPQQGPHCDQFLRKMGLAKSDASETEEHHCDMSYVNITCTRWRAYCSKMETNLARGEPICIEVYLGPVGHKVLLEQWIITQKEKQPPPTMTLPSLCSAIRSQLYFSQISAWCDLIKKSDKTVSETGRVIYSTPPTTSAAGDLATTTNNAIQTIATAITTTSTHHPTVMSSLSATSPTAGSGNISGGVGGVGCSQNRPSSPRLNIFYRITQYDGTACFNLKPNVHNFPNVNISENCSVSVCLKSLPRITGGIPKIGTTTTTTSTQQRNISPIGPTATPFETPPVISQTPTTCLVAKDNTLAATTAKATTSAISNAAIVAANIVLAATTITAAITATATATTTTTNANKTTNLKMNCDNNLKEHQQKQKPFTASISSSSSSSLRCSYSNIKSNSNTSSLEDASDRDQDFDFDYDCEKYYNIDLSAGGDSSNILCGSDMVGSASVGDCDSNNSSFSTNNCGNLSHREKQLLKYRKRMLKRDKKQQLRKTNDNFSSNNQTPHRILNQMENYNNNQQMEQGEDDADENIPDVVNDNGDNDGNNSDTAVYCETKYSVNNLVAKGQRQQLPNNHKNSIPCTTNQLQEQQQQQQHPHHAKMISTGTQTMNNTCTSCGSEKSMICLKCTPLETNNADAVTTTATDSPYNYEDIMDAESSSSASSLSSSDIIHTPRNKAELLLQAIQRTPKSNKKHKHKSKDSNQMAAIKQQKQHQNSPTPTTTTTTTQMNSKISLIRTSSPHNSNTWNVSGNITHSNSKSSNSSHSSIIKALLVNNSSANSNNTIVGCRMCKRQKTQHNFNQNSNEDISTDDYSALANNSLNSSCDSSMLVGNSTNQNNSSTDDEKATDDDDNEKYGGNGISPNAVDNIVTSDINRGDHMAKMLSAKSSNNENEVMEEEYFESSTKLTPHIDRCTLSANGVTQFAQMPSSDTAAEKAADQTRSCATPPLEDYKENSSFSKEGTTMLAQFKTPTSGGQHQNAIKTNSQQPLQPQKLTLKPNLLRITCNFNKGDKQQISKLNLNSIINTNDNTSRSTHNPLLLRRSLPKVNLTPIFCNENSMMAVSSSPIPISNGVCNGTTSNISATVKPAEIDVTDTSPTFSFELPSSPAPTATVQKSNSAPTLPNSPSLSPRFVKSSTIYKRRSRHLSDRSDRSSLGSDEQVSDEDIDSGMYSPFATSPVKLKTRLTAVFGRKPLLGNLEECLLQQRFVPKSEVMGFKLLLGASGGFCPTQLTIPAAAYFYEFKGDTLSTPYLCEIRLPRKGYTVPRCGTVQATLLNPMGTVVRMFVIPYDMRDMPTFHQTFIRQRILADTGVQATNNESNQNFVDKEFNDVASSHHHKVEQLAVKLKRQQQQLPPIQQQRSPQCNNENQMGYFISTENMKSLRYSIHLRFQTSRTDRLMLHTDIRLLISRRTDCDTAAAHAKGVLEAPNELITNTMMPTNPKYSARHDQTTSKI